MTPIEYIQQHPDATDEEVLAAVNAPVYSPVELADIERWTVFGTRRARLRMARDNEQLPVELRVGIADLLEALNSPRLTYLDLSDAEIRTRWQQGAAGLAQVGVIDETERDFLLSLGVTQANYTQEDVTAARRSLAAAAVRAEAASFYNRIVEIIDAGEAAGKLPTLAEAIEEARA